LLIVTYGPDVVTKVALLNILLTPFHKQIDCVWKIG